jgi:hypothetical protein
MMQGTVTLYQLYYNNEKRKRTYKVENYTNEELSEELHDEEPEESEDDPPLLFYWCIPWIFESDDDESCSSDLDDFNDYGSEEEEEVGAVIDDASHFLKCVFYISIRVLELKKGAKELNNLAHLKTKILNIKNRSKWSVVLTVLHFSKDFSCLSQPLERVESVLVRSSCRSTLCKKRQNT